MNLGIDLIRFYTSSFYLPLCDFALARNISSEKISVGIGQEQMSVLPPDEDIVTMAANAAYDIVQKTDKNRIKALILATESGIDQSKSAGIFVHQLLELPSDCRVVEIKQACYGSTFALQSALAMIEANPEDQILVIGTDVARYALNSRAEPTQGCGAVAMLLSANPRLFSMDKKSVFITEDVMDFWRPNYLEHAIVDGHYSTRVYLRALQKCWTKYVELTKILPEHIHHFCFHLPFTRMAEKALKQIFQQKQDLNHQLKQALPGLIYNKVIGNSYTASLYINLCSLFDHSKDNLSEKRIALFSYGSGYVAEFFSGLVQPQYLKYLMKDLHQKMIANRQRLSFQEYIDFYDFALPKNDGSFSTPSYTTGRFRFLGTNKHKRLYESNALFRS